MYRQVAESPARSPVISLARSGIEPLPPSIYTNATPTVPSLITSATSGISPTAGSLKFSVTDTAFLTATGSPVIMCISFGTSASERIFIQKFATGARLRFTSQSGGTTETYGGYLSTMPNGTHEVLIVWGSGFLTFYWNGMKIAYIEASHVMPSIDSIYVGRLNSGTSNNYAQTIADLEVWNVALSDFWSRSITQPTILSGISFTDIDIIAFLGQSNSSGQAAGPAAYSGTAGAPSSKMFKLTNAMSLVTYADSYDNATGSKITALDDTSPPPDVGLAGFLIDKYSQVTGRDTAALPANKSTTSYAGSVPTWDCNTTNATYVTSGTKFKGIAPSAVAAINQIHMAKQFGYVKGMAINLGEQDIADDTPRATYSAKQIGHITETRLATALDLPTLLMGFPAYDSSWADAQADWDAIDGAQEDVAASMSNVWKVAGTGIAGNPSDDVHYDLTGYATCGDLGGTEAALRFN